METKNKIPSVYDQSIMLKRLVDSIVYYNDTSSESDDFAKDIMSLVSTVEKCLKGEISIPPYLAESEFYKEYPMIKIPDFLGDDWEDSSWHNDITASSIWRGKTPIGENKLRLWVYDDNPIEREDINAPKYSLEISNKEWEYLEYIECNSDEDCKTLIKLLTKKGA